MNKKFYPNNNLNLGNQDLRFKGKEIFKIMLIVIMMLELIGIFKLISPIILSMLEQIINLIFQTFS